MWLKHALLVVGLLCLLGGDVPYPSLIRSVSAAGEEDDEEESTNLLPRTSREEASSVTDPRGIVPRVREAWRAIRGRPNEAATDFDDTWNYDSQTGEVFFDPFNADEENDDSDPDFFSIRDDLSLNGSIYHNALDNPKDDDAKEGEDNNNNKKKSGFRKQMQKIKNAFRRGSKKEHSRHKGHKSQKHQGSARPSWRERLRARFRRGKKQKKVAVSESRENLIDSNEANASSASNSDPAGEGVVPANGEGTHEGNAHHQDVSTTEKNKKHGKHKKPHKKPWSKLFRPKTWKRTKKSDVAETRAAVQEGTNVTEPTPAPVSAPSSRLGGGESSSETNKVDAESTSTAEGLASSEPNPTDDTKSGSKRIPTPSSNLNGSERPSQHSSASSTME